MYLMQLRAFVLVSVSTLSAAFGERVETTRRRMPCFPNCCGCVGGIVDYAMYVVVVKPKARMRTGTVSASEVTSTTLVNA